jgi:hypothetical protein
MDTIKAVLRPVWNSPFVYKTRGVFFTIMEICTAYSHEKKRFKAIMGYELDLNNPQTFSQHIVRKKIHDRRNVLPVVADKYAVREYIKKRLGDKEETILIPLLYAGDPEHIPFDTIEGEYIIKANHNSGPHFIVSKGEVPDRKKIIAQMKSQLAIPYGILKHEWAYRKIKHTKVVVERLLRDENGAIPKDYKFHMIHGQCAFIQVDFDRFIDHSRTLYDKDWNRIPVTLKFKQGGEAERPQNLSEMLYYAETLSKDFDYIRIDLYSIGDAIYFGEMTHYPGSGTERFTPESFDWELGHRWNTYEQEGVKK